MSTVLKTLREVSARAGSGSPARWVYVPYDQLTTTIGPACTRSPGDVGLVFVESRWRARRRPYHRQKLAFGVANQRAFALEAAGRGHAVQYAVHDGPDREALVSVIEERGPLTTMEPAERELREDLRPLVEDGRLEVVPHEGWLTSRELFLNSQKKPAQFRMDAFYRAARRATGLLMEDGKPTGGKLSFDTDNRRRYKGAPLAPAVPRFEVDALKAEVVELIEEEFSRHPGALDISTIPVHRHEHEALWRWFLLHGLHDFGPYQDAMAEGLTTLFHSRISASLHLHRILPRRAVQDVVDADVPLASKEGFVRQVLGWREFVRHVHVETDGFRDLPHGAPPVAPVPGDAGFERARAEPWPEPGGGPDGGACPSALNADQQLPPAFWGVESGLRCLDVVVEEVWREGYGHHITRLMILGNVATLLGVEPRAITDWFWVAYQDAFDWVVEPNVLGMGTFALGDLMTTKPYVSGSAYVNKMSDYCKGCAFDPQINCPIRSLYWDFLARNEAQLGGNPRLRMPFASLRRMEVEQLRAHQRRSERSRTLLARGKPVTPHAIE